MGEVYFYHLTQNPLEQTLSTLLGKALGAGWQVELRARSTDTCARLDAALWLGSEDGFLPHGLAGGPHDAAQPILLACDPVADAAARACLVSVEGADITAFEVSERARVMVLFDGHDPGAVQTAREQWKRLTSDGAAAQYWSEESGRWEKKAESGSQTGA